jgi:hypothetical protein
MVGPVPLEAANQDKITAHGVSRSKDQMIPKPRSGEREVPTHTSNRMHETRVTNAAPGALKLRKLSTHGGLRVLAWNGDDLYVCCGYQLLCLNARDLESKTTNWQPTARFRPAWWRSITSRATLTHRLVRDGFHALAVLEDQSMIAAVPGAIVTRTAASGEFHPTHQIRRGTRPLHITAVPGGNIYWGEYFDNPERAEVHIFASADRGETWHIAYTFPSGDIRHVHNIVHDRWANCLWILTGDEGAECKVLCASCDLSSVETILSGNQQARAVAAIPTKDALYLSTDTPLEQNHVLRLDRAGYLEPVAELASSSIFGCQTGNALFFSTMVEPSPANPTREVHLAGSADGKNWQVLARWQKDGWPMRYFQYGNAILADGENTTSYLALTTIAVKQDDLVTTVYEVESKAKSRKPEP